MNLQAGRLARRFIGRGALDATASVSYTGPGDVVGSALAWWGLRAYSSATRGNNVIKLRESGGNTTSDFVSLSDGSLDVASIATFKGANNLFVHTLYDQTGNGYNYTQTTTANQIPFTLSGLGSLPVLDPASGTRFPAVTGPTQSTPFTLLAVANADASLASDQYLMSFGVDVSVLHHNTTASVRFASSTAGAYTLTDSTWHSIIAVANGASGHLYLDATDQGAYDFGSVGLTGNMYLLTEVFNVDYLGKWVEGGIWGSAFDATKATNMDTNISTYWGI